MTEKQRYLQNKAEAFRQRGLNPNDHSYNCHHIYFQSDQKNGLLPDDFDIHAVDNLLPLPVEVHEELHNMVERYGLHEDISCREDLAYLAEIGELNHFEMPQVRKDN